MGLDMEINQRDWRGMKRIGLIFSILFAVSLALANRSWGQSPYIATSQNYYCAGSDDEVTLYCNVLAFDPNTNVADWTFAWSPADEVSDPSVQTVMVSPSSTMTFSAIMTAPDGTVYEDEITITVYPEFSVLTEPSVAECSTVGVQLNAVVDVSNAMNWQWDPQIGLSSANIANPFILEEISGVYTVTAVIAGLGGASCSSSAQVFVTSIFPSMELGPDVIACAGDEVMIDPGLPVNYTYDWTVSGEDMPVLAVTNSGTYGVTVTSPEGCENADAITVTFTDGPSLDLPDSLVGCSETGIEIDATPEDLSTGPFAYLWSNGANASTATYFESQAAMVQVTDAGGCVSTGTVWLDVLPSPSFYLPVDTALCFDDIPDNAYSISVPAGFAGYQWLDGASSNIISIDGPGTYGVSVSNDIGCVSTQYVSVVDFCAEPLLFVPSAFTPDGDGLNEVLRIEGRNLVQLDFKLYNRWGELVWQAEELGAYWHAQGPAKTHYVEDEMYHWRARYRYYLDPEGQLSPWQQAAGSVLILR